MLTSPRPPLGKRRQPRGVKTEKVSISMPQTLKNRIDALSNARGRSRSELIARFVREGLAAMPASGPIALAS
jgi:hypothetical protein